MPYFDGSFAVKTPLQKEHKTYLERFAEIRHMHWDAVKLKDIPDPIREAAGLPLGPEGIYFTGIANVDWDFGKQCRYHPALINANGLPSMLPNHWCSWVPNEDGTAIEWNGDEKFYTYQEWLHILIEHFLARFRICAQRDSLLRRSRRPPHQSGKESSLHTITSLFGPALVVGYSYPKLPYDKHRRSRCIVMPGNSFARHFPSPT